MSTYADIVTFISGGLAVIAIILAVYFYRTRKRPSRLYYIPGDTINIYRSLSNEFENLKVTYNDKTIGDRILYHTGILQCKGYDINSDNNLIHIILPDGYEWLDVKVSSDEEEIDPEKREITGKKDVPIFFKSMRKNEKIKISSIIKCTKETSIDPSDLINRFTFKHRIKETDKIKLYSHIKARTEIIKWIIESVSCTLAIVFGTLAFLDQSNSGVLVIVFAISLVTLLVTTYFLLPQKYRETIIQTIQDELSSRISIRI